MDNGSPFTDDILTLLDTLGQRYNCKSWTEVSLPLPYKRVILSGRRKNERRINAINSIIVRKCHQDNIPLLGICYGAEIIALTFGGSIRKIEHAQGLTKIAVFEENDLIKEKGYVEVYESHSYSIARLPPDFISIASSNICQYELFRHKAAKMYGTQFHPERSGNVGINIFRNFLNL